MDPTIKVRTYFEIIIIGRVLDSCGPDPQLLLYSGNSTLLWGLYFGPKIFIPPLLKMIFSPLSRHAVFDIYRGLFA